MTLSRLARPTLPSLTGIRFFAAFIVTLFHANATLNALEPGEGFPLLRFGYVGVSLFFVLSGFILTYTYIQDDNTLRGDRPTFWRARFARVYPVYFLGLLLAAPLFLKRLVTPAPAAEFHEVLATTILAPALLQSWWPPSACQWNCVGWSLSVETLFYALFPLLGVWLARRSLRGSVVRAVLVWGAALAVAVLYIVVAPDGPHVADEASKWFWINGLKYNPVMHLGEFSIGIACGLLFLRHPITNVRVLRVAGLVAVGVVVVVLTPALGVPYPLLHTGILAPAFAAIIYVLACRDAAGVRGVLGSPVMFKLGESSYALYLVHATMLGYASIIMRRWHLGHTGIFVTLIAAIVVAVGISIVIFDRVEEPARKWLRRRGTLTAVPSTSVTSAS